MNDKTLKQIIREELGLQENLNESYVTQAKKYNLPTELLSDRNKQEHQKLLEKYGLSTCPFLRKYFRPKIYYYDGFVGIYEVGKRLWFFRCLAKRFRCMRTFLEEWLGSHSLQPNVEKIYQRCHRSSFTAGANRICAHCSCGLLGT